jgi:hypothetical protein
MGLQQIFQFGFHIDPIRRFDIEHCGGSATAAETALAWTKIAEGGQIKSSRLLVRRASLRKVFQRPDTT